MMADPVIVHIIRMTYLQRCIGGNPPTQFDVLGWERGTLSQQTKGSFVAEGTINPPGGCGVSASVAQDGEAI
jgi:hypothetical protein